MKKSRSKKNGEKAKKGEKERTEERSEGRKRAEVTVMGIGRRMFVWLYEVTLPPIVAVLMGFVVAGISVSLMGVEPVVAMRYFVRGVSASAYGICEIVVKALPLLFTGLSVAFAQRCGLLNIGAEGQLFIGGLTGTIVGAYIRGLPWPIHALLALAAGFVGGGLWGVGPGYFKVRFGTNEVISTIMFDYLAVFIVSYAVTGPLKEPPGFIPQSPEIAPGAILGNILPGTRLHAGAVVGLLAVLAFWLIIWRTRFGYQIRAVGANPRAAHYAGIDVGRSIVATMFIAGGFAGLAGCVEILGVLHRLREAFSPGWGWDGIAVALLGKATPLGVTLSALLMGFIRGGVNAMQRATGVPIGLVYVVQAVIIICVVAREYRLPKSLRSLRFPFLEKSPRLKESQDAAGGE